MRRTDQSAPVRVLLVEARRDQQQVLGALIAGARLELVGTVGTATEALAAVARLRPEVVAINVQLYGGDGLALTRQIMQRCPTPIVLYDAGLRSCTPDEATAAGALALVQHPTSRAAADTSSQRDMFVKTLAVMAGVPVVTRFATRTAPAPQLRSAGYQLLAIAASTGGPSAVQRIVCQLGPRFPLPIIIVQHIADTFVQSLAEWLISVTAMPVNVVQQELALQPGQLYLAESRHHLMVPRRGWVTVRPGDQITDAYCPSADRMFHSVAQIYGQHAIGLILSGMGDDGARGLAALHQAGGLTLAQNEASCVVYGMPQAAVRANAVDYSDDLDQLAALIERHTAVR